MTELDPNTRSDPRIFPERLKLGVSHPMLEESHLARYRYACRFVRDKDVLDLACGSGYGSHLMANAGARSIIGIDNSDEAIRDATASYLAPSIRYLKADAQSLDAVPDSSLDVVVSFETIEHLPDPSKYCDEVWRVLRSAGRYIVSTPDRRLSSPRYPLRGRPDNPWHLHEFTEREFLEFLVTHRFKVEELLGQAFVPYLLTFWPVQFSVRAACKVFKGFGAARLRERLYDVGTGHELLQRPAWSGVANYWVARCTK